MSKKNLLIIFLVLVVLAGLALIANFLLSKRNSTAVSAFRVESFPKTAVYLNDRPVGETPYSNENLEPGEYKLKLIVTGTTGTFLPWETKIKLTKDSLTYVNRNLASSEDLVSGQILWLEKLASDKATELAIISDPDDATVFVDQLEKGKTSLILKDLPVGDHEIKISDSGFGDQIIKGKIIEGYRLNTVVKLGKINPEITSPQLLATPSANLEQTASAAAVNSQVKPYIIVNETGTGFLRVRVGPSLNASESARIKPGEKYSLISEQAGWVQIKLPNSVGWVSDQFVQKIK